MARIVYKCETCGISFPGNEDTKYCPNCNSKIRNGSSGTVVGRIVDLLKKNIVISLLILLALVILVLFFIGTSDEPILKNQKIELSFDQYDSYLEIAFKDSLSNKLPDSQVRLLMDSAFFAVAPEDKFNLVGNKIYPCENASFRINWKKDGFFKGNRPWPNKEYIGNFEFKNNAQPDDKANCDGIEKLLIQVSALDDCGIAISTNFDLKDRIVLISVNGKNGTYENKRTWKFTKDQIKYDVWGVIEGNSDTVQAIAGIGSAIGCNPINATTFETITGKFAQNVSDNYSAFSSLITSKIILKYNDKKSDLSFISMQLRIAKRDGKTISYNIVWGTDKKSVNSVNFIVK